MRPDGHGNAGAARNQRMDPVRAKVKRFLAASRYGSVCNDRRWLGIIRVLAEAECGVRVKYLDEDAASAEMRVWSPANFYVEATHGGPRHVIEIEWMDVRGPGKHEVGVVEALRAAKAALSTVAGGIRIWGHVRPGTAPEFLSQAKPRDRECSSHEGAPPVALRVPVRGPDRGHALPDPQSVDRDHLSQGGR